ncbi:MAG: response regulator [Candidatus Omnitrophota bacterium]
MKKILVVEDEVDIAKVLLKRLNDAGFETQCALDAYLAVKFCHDFAPDLVILDLMLPAGGGLFVLENIRASAKTNSIPVLVLTGIKDEEYKQKVLDQGVSAYMEKPYEHQELIKTINKILVV